MQDLGPKASNFGEIYGDERGGVKKEGGEERLPTSHFPHIFSGNNMSRV